MRRSNIISFILGAVIFSSITVFAQEVLRVEENKYPVYVDGKIQKVEGYNINDYTYLKLSDFSKVLPVGIEFDNKAESIMINTEKMKQPELKKITEDGLDIHYIEGIGCINAFDLQNKYSCLVIGSSSNHRLKIFGEMSIQPWDMDVTKPLVDTDSFSIEGNKWYINLDYYEKCIRDILKQPRVNMSFIKKDGLNIYYDKNIEYALPTDIIKTYLGQDYVFNCDINKKFKITRLWKNGDDYDPKNNIVLITDIPSKEVYGHLCIEYKYLIEEILPKIRK